MHQSAQAFRRSLIRRALLIFFMAFGVYAPIVFAQQPVSDERERAAQLFKSGKYVEALPLLEKLAAANPKDGALQAQAGIANFVASNAARDETEEKRLRLRARAMLGEAKNLGVQDALVDEIFAAIPLDGGGGRSKLSENAEANKLMREGEAAYSRNELDKARALYEQAFALDQKSYLAALFAGDMYFKLGYTEKDAAKKTRLLTEAGVWFAKAIAIDPNVETAYRYWGSALMTQGKMSEAREKVVEAFITNPYTRLSPEGLYRWANMMSITPAHPNIQIPVSVARKDEKNISVTLDQKMIDEKKRDGSIAWVNYGVARSGWMTSKFAKEYPSEKTYRHTLREEAEALRFVVSGVEERQKKGDIAALDSSLANLIKLDKEGLLEAHILLARPDAGIAQDYLAYKSKNADKLRRYVIEYVLAASR